MKVEGYNYSDWYKRLSDYLKEHYNYTPKGQDEADPFIDDCFDEGIAPEACARGIADANHLTPVKEHASWLDANKDCLRDKHGTACHYGKEERHG